MVPDCEDIADAGLTLTDVTKKHFKKWSIYLHGTSINYVILNLSINFVIVLLILSPLESGSESAKSIVFFIRFLALLALTLRLSLELFPPKNPIWKFERKYRKV